MALPEWLVGVSGVESPPQADRIHSFEPEAQRARRCPEFGGIRVYPQALSAAEADQILKQIDARPFAPSQSGKRKQHFGPRFNFMRRRMNAERFAGLPDYALLLEDRLRERVRADGAGDPEDLAACRRALADFQTTDVFVLRYLEHEQSNLDFHVDDLYAYGEAIIDVSLDSDSILTLLGPLATDQPESELRCVRVPLPARSLAVVYGRARLDWQHAILPQDIRGVRTSITLRTLAPALRTTEAGRAVLTRSRPHAIE
jgi:alkylated DNA repair protein alkB family protein 4